MLWIKIALILISIIAGYEFYLRWLEKEEAKQNLINIFKDTK